MPFSTSVFRQICLNTKLFNNVLKGIGEPESRSRLTPHLNHLAWISGHLTSLRYDMGRMLLGLKAEFPYTGMYCDPGQPPPGNRPLDESLSYPPLVEILEYWNSLAFPFAASLPQLSKEQLSREMPFSVPVGGNRLVDLLVFVANHEAYHIGQMSMIRKGLGHGSMSFL